MLQTPGVGMMNIPTPALALPYPKLDPKPSGQTIVVYGGSSSVGSMATQLATASGAQVIAIASFHNSDLCKSCGASAVFDYKDPSMVNKIVEEVRGKGDFIGIFDAIGIPESYAHSLEILSKLGGGHLASVHPPSHGEHPRQCQDGHDLWCERHRQPGLEGVHDAGIGGGQAQMLTRASNRGQRAGAHTRRVEEKQGGCQCH